MSSSEARTWVFSYGSNSCTQLRARVLNPNLTCLPASVENFTRVFCLSSKNWSTNSTPSGSASLAPAEGACTYGCAALMTDAELERLDVFEGCNAESPELGVYRRTQIGINVWPSRGAPNSQQECGIAYIANNMTWRFPPSEQYLTAIHVMLREQWQQPGDECESDINIVVRGVMASPAVKSCDIDADALTTTTPPPVQPTELYTWRYPGRHSLTLPAVCVEVNVLRETPWVMPRTIKEVVGKLASVGVHSAAQLAVWLGSRKLRDELNCRLRDAGQSEFEDHTLLLFKQVIGV